MFDIHENNNISGLINIKLLAILVSKKEQNMLVHYHIHVVAQATYVGICFHLDQVY
jgi:hypothetical protein